MLNTQMFCANSTVTWRKNWTHIWWPFACIRVTHWLSETCSQFSLSEIVQSKPQRRCWTSSWNNPILYTCTSSTSWNTTQVKSTSIRHSSKADTKVSTLAEGSDVVPEVPRGQKLKARSWFWGKSIRTLEAFAPMIVDQSILHFYYS